MPIEPTSLALAGQEPHGDRRTGWSAFLGEPKRLGGWVIHHCWMTGAALAITTVAVVTALWWLSTPSTVEYATAPVTRGNVITTITASVTVNPVVTVSVGTYVSGTIEAL